jgi:hypothetical protein
MEASSLVVGRRVLDALEHHAQFMRQRKTAAAAVQPAASTNALEHGVGWLVGPTSSAFELINCIACTEFVDGGAGGDRPPPNWDEESRFVAAALPQGLAARGLYFCFVEGEDKDDATPQAERHLELLRGFFERNAQALRPVFAPCGGDVVVAVKALRMTTEEQQEQAEEDEDARRPVFYRLRLDQAAAAAAADVTLEKVASVEEAKAGQALRDFGLFRTRLSVPLHATSVGTCARLSDCQPSSARSLMSHHVAHARGFVGSLQEQVDAIEAQINGEGVHFLFPSGDKGGALVNKTTNASFPAKEFQQQSKGAKGAKVLGHPSLFSLLRRLVRVRSVCDGESSRPLAGRGSTGQLSSHRRGGQAVHISVRWRLSGQGKRQGRCAGLELHACRRWRLLRHSADSLRP